MRDRLDGDLRRHAKHGHDRIAHRVSALTGATLEEIRASLLPPVRRPARYTYECPSCGVASPPASSGYVVVRSVRAAVRSAIHPSFASRCMGHDYGTVSRRDSGSLLARGVLGAQLVIHVRYAA